MCMLYKKNFLYISVVVVSFFVDVMFSSSRVPVIFIAVCGIVIVYEFVSPFIYSSR